MVYNICVALYNKDISLHLGKPIIISIYIWSNSITDIFRDIKTTDHINLTLLKQQRFCCLGQDLSLKIWVQSQFMKIKMFVIVLCNVKYEKWFACNLSNNHKYPVKKFKQDKWHYTDIVKKIHTGIIYLKCHYTAFSSDIPNLKRNYSYICGNAMQLTMHSILFSHAYFDICVHWTRSNIFTIWMKISAFDARLMSGQGACNWNQMLCISCLQLLLQGLFKSRVHILREGIIQSVCITKDITYWMFKQLYF